MVFETIPLLTQIKAINFQILLSLKILPSSNSSGFFVVCSAFFQPRLCTYWNESKHVDKVLKAECFSETMLGSHLLFQSFNINLLVIN